MKNDSQALQNVRMNSEWNKPSGEIGLKTAKLLMMNNWQWICKGYQHKSHSLFKKESFLKADNQVIRLILTSYSHIKNRAREQKGEYFV